MTNQLSTRYAYIGREFDDFSGLHYYRARWYDGNLGRFISEDPIGFEGNDINLFAYVHNSPLNYFDRKAHKSGRIRAGNLGHERKTLWPWPERQNKGKGV